MKDIKGFEGLYAVTEDGRIWAYPKITAGKHANRNIHGMWMKGINHSGYVYVCLYKNGKCTRKFIHRLVLEAFMPNPENKPFCNHKDCNTTNNHIDNLEWCTNKENIIHAYKNGLIHVTEKMRENSRYWGKKNNHFAIEAKRNIIKKEI
jgi:hypothetical protein